MATPKPPKLTLVDLLAGSAPPDRSGEEASPAVTQDFAHTFFPRPGVLATVGISPCSWMYPNYGLQVEVAVNGTRTYFYDKSTRFADATTEDAIRLAKQVVVGTCTTCGDPTIPVARKGQCEACFMKDLKATYDKATQEEAKKEAAQDRRKKKAGYTHKIVATVHPPVGNDYTIVAYSKGTPSTADVAKVLKARRSEILDDYVVRAL